MKKDIQHIILLLLFPIFCLGICNCSHDDSNILNNGMVESSSIAAGVITAKVCKSVSCYQLEKSNASKLKSVIEYIYDGNMITLVRYRDYSENRN